MVRSTLFDYDNHREILREVGIAGHVVTGTALAMVSLSPFVPNRVARFVPLLGSAILASQACKLYQVHTRQENILSDYTKIGDQARQNAAHDLYKEDYGQVLSQYVDSLSGQAVSATGIDGNANPVDKANAVDRANPSIESFDWGKLSNTNEFPHLWIVAGTGMGKSTFAQWVCDRLGGEILVADPHFQPGNFPKADLIVGAGMNLGDTAILPGKAKRGQSECAVIGEPNEATSVCEFLVWLWHEMKRRYALFAQGKVDYPTTNVILDEVPAYAQIDGVSFIFKELIAQARKVKIRVIFLTQGTQVKLIGLEGMSDLRENLTKILLKDFALKEARDRLNQCKAGSRGEIHWQSVLDYLNSCDRPALVNDLPACVPTLQ